MGGGFGKISIMTGGFLGGLVAGAAAALFVMLIRQIKVPAVLESVKMIIITPLLAGICTLLFMYIGPGKFFAQLNSGLVEWLTSMGTNNLLILGFILGAMACFDMGGPVNKAAICSVSVSAPVVTSLETLRSSMRRLRLQNVSLVCLLASCQYYLSATSTKRTDWQGRLQLSWASVESLKVQSLTL
ncbi:PTS systemfructose-specific IIB /IIC component [Vibrio maritimus]|uniref:PTS systemfructose-specific IIB /IIC component n=1 Tax=Vibrio maritimus TaxID=990268 RepID=A0A090SDI7_9VIBR|nr:PTS systemfructose-specific IIB /IIC component [Vibrio maritimus]